MKSAVSLFHSFLLGSLCLLHAPAGFAGTTESLDSLGTQEQLLDKAHAPVPANTYRVIQKRVIDRDGRLEFDFSGAGMSGGDSYYTTKSLGLQAEYHFSYRWSVGVRHDWFFNDLSPEGQRRFDEAYTAYQAGNMGVSRPDLDWPLSKDIATISFYPLYGKMSWFESTVSYFDVYLLAGGGMMNLSRGQSGLGTAGMGVGMWWTQHLTSR
ncbi:MAG: hypothetical protein C5B49_06230, partial [Bdellovibrio sp.]